MCAKCKNNKTRLISICFLSLLFIVKNICYAQNIDKFVSDIVKLNVFIEQETNKSKIYLGEAIYCDYNLVISSELFLIDMKLKALPTFLSFKSYEVNLGQLHYKDTIIEGLQFKKALLHRYLLIPRREGEIKIDEIVFDLKLKIPLSEKYAELYANRYYEYLYSVSSGIKKIEVIPLPPNNEKCEFVGDFEIDYSLNRITASKNENISLNINISGIGNLTTRYIPTIKNTDGLKTNVYKVFDTFEIQHREIISKKSYDITLLSSINKEYMIPPIRILCFSPTLKEYYYLSVDAIPIFFIDKDNDNHKTKSANQFMYLAITIVIIGIIILIIMLYYYYKRLGKIEKKAHQKININQSIKNINNQVLASDTSKIYLAKAYHHLNVNHDIFLRELNIGIDEYIKERFQIDKNIYSKEEIVEKLNENGVPIAIAQDYLQISKKIEETRFSENKVNMKNENIDMQKLFSLVEIYINELENYIA